MFTDFAEVWTPVLPAAALVEGRPLASPLAGERLVFFRDAEGRARALLDTCPHRGVQLSLGRVCEGQLVCPFHGWRFSGDGACTRVPFNPDARRDPLAATALPVAEAGGLLWVYTRPGAAPEAGPVVPEALTREGLRVFIHHEDWACHWTRAQENMLDFPHLPFVHGWTIGAGLRRALTDQTVLRQRIEAQPFGFTTHTHIDDQPEARLDWLMPNGMTLYINEGRMMLRMHLWCVPLSADRTRMLLVSVRGFGQWNPLLALTDRFNLRILREDQAIVESSSPAEVPPPGQEVSVASDKATLRFRQWYHGQLKGRAVDYSSRKKSVSSGAPGMTA